MFYQYCTILAHIQKTHKHTHTHTPMNTHTHKTHTHTKHTQTHTYTYTDTCTKAHTQTFFDFLHTSKYKTSGLETMERKMTGIVFVY